MEVVSLSSIKVRAVEREPQLSIFVHLVNLMKIGSFTALLYGLPLNDTVTNKTQTHTHTQR